MATVLLNSKELNKYILENKKTRSMLRIQYSKSKEKIDKSKTKMLGIFKRKGIGTEEINDFKEQKYSLQNIEEILKIYFLFIDLGYENKGSYIKIDKKLFDYHFKEQMELAKKDLKKSKIALNTDNRNLKHKFKYDLSVMKLQTLEIISENTTEKNKNTQNKQIDLYIQAFKSKNIIVESIGKENDNAVFKTRNYGDVKMPIRITNINSKIIKDFFLEENFGMLMTFFNKGFKDSRLEKLKKETYKKTNSTNLFLRKVSLTTVGLYVVLSGEKEQPIMISWQGKVLKKKQGKVLWELN